MKAYIAAPFFNDIQLGQVLAVENLLYEKGIEYFSPRSFGVIKDMTPEEKEKNMHSIYNKNVEQLMDCNVIVVLVDHKDTGTTWELGFVSGANHVSNEYYKKTIITLSFDKKPVNVMLKYCIDAHAETIDELSHILVEVLGGGNLNKIQNNLEVNE